MESSATTLVEVSKFRFGAPVLTDENEEGSLEALLLRDGSREVTHLRVKFGWGPFGSTYTLPVTAVRRAVPSEVELHVTREELEKTGKEKVAAQEISSNTQIVLNGKRLGTLAQVTVDTEPRTLRTLVVDRGLRNEVLVPAEDIVRIQGRQIAVDQKAPGERPLITYRDDQELYDEVRDAIEGYTRLRVDMPGIIIKVVDGTVWLLGHVSSDINRRLVQDQLGHIRGLAELHNDLIADTDLASAVSLALARDPRTAGQPIGVYPVLGVVRLRGRVRSEVARQAATEVARAVPGVEQVENELIVDPGAEVIPVLAGVTNQEDRVPGGR